MTRDGFDFLLFYLSDYDYASHAAGPDAASDVLARCDDAVGGLVRAAGGLDAFLERYAVIVMSDHGQTPVREIARLGDRFRHAPETLVAASNRAAHVYRLGPGAPTARGARRAARRRAVGRGRALPRGRRDRRAARGRRSCGSRRTRRTRSRATRRSSTSPTPSRAPSRRSRARTPARSSSPRRAAGSSRTSVGGHHLGGGSHGSLVAGDSLVPVLTVGLEGAVPARRRRRRPRRPRHFGVAAPRTRSTGGVSGIRRPSGVSRRRGADGRAPASPARDLGRARARGDGARAPRGVRPAAARRPSRTTTPRCRSARARRSRSRSSSPRCASCSRSTAPSACSTSAPGRGTRPRCSTSSRASVVSIERIPRCSPERARAGARPRRATRTSRCASPTERLGAPDRAPFDAISVAAATDRVPPALYEQLAVGGRMVLPLGGRGGQRLVRVVRTDGGPVETPRSPAASSRSSRAERIGAPRPERPLRSPGVMDDGTVTTGREVRAGRVDAALRRRANWEQLVKFCVVGATGYVVNLAVYTLPARGRRAPLRARGDRLVPRRRHEQLHVEPRLDVPRPARARRPPGPPVPRRLDERARRQPPRALTCWSRPGSARSSPRRSRSCSSRPVNFIGNKLWSFRHRRLSPGRRGVLLTRAAARPPPRRPRRVGRGDDAAHDARPAVERRRTRRRPRLTEAEAIEASSRTRRSRDWLERYPPEPVTDATFDRRTRTWTVHVWSGEAGEVARASSATPTAGSPRPGRGHRSPGRWPRAAPARSAGSSSRRGRSGSASRRSSCSGSSTCGGRSAAHARPARAPLVRRLARVLQPRRGLPERRARRAPARLPARAHGVDRLPPASRPDLLRSRWPVWALAAATLFLVGFRVGLNVETRAAP